MKKDTWNALFQPDRPEDEPFCREHGEMLFARLRFVCLMVVLSYPLYLALDLYFLSTGEKRLNLGILAFLYFLSFFMSLTFLLARKRLIRRQQSGRRDVLHYVYSYFCFYIFIGASGSLNSQFLTGNIYAYLIILLAASVIFPIPPRKSAVMLAGIHVLFLAGLMKIGGFSLTSIMNMINSTAAAGIAFFYRPPFISIEKKRWKASSSFKQMKKHFAFYLI
ncbi:hypothetical protein L2D08_00870 [Domibacillus sp. PGB-M46]|uniref:hypothetical protein n=1 Tax=Domibacillus sp. PGB-M46 TaxID=2910255 RepID=UPI001F5AAEFD|nr:hypothetical protein [Domibacillus sp. PGB-M46]MCI2252911.1 hypothetical protein [Domibacillus sp. PGB-M46]